MKMLPIRFPLIVETRAKALVGPISADEGYESIRVTMTSVLRMALMEGLRVLEQRYSEKS